MNKLFFLVCLIFTLFIDFSLGCSLAGKLFSDFDEKEYIFIGEVVGSTEPAESAKIRGKAYGLIVKVRESVHLPKTPKTHFEVFPIQLWADCSFGGTNIEELKNTFPVNSEIRVIAKEAEILPSNLSGGNIRLEDRPGELGSLALNYEKEKTRMTSASSVFDYQSFQFRFNEDSDTKYLLPSFEIRKDLLRLKRSKTQNERNSILERLENFPNCCGDVDFYTIFNTYSANNSESERRIDGWIRKKLTEDQYKHYKTVQTATSELVKMGFKSEAAEEAVEKALAEGKELTNQQLLERSLEILRKKKAK